MHARLTRVPLYFVFALMLALGASDVRAAGGDSDSTSADPSSPVGQAKALIDARDYAGAVPILEGAVKATPRNADAWNWLGYATRQLGRFAESERHYLKALEIDPAHRGALEYLGELYVKTQRMADAKAMLARLDRECLFGCKEYDELKQAIETGTVKSSSW